MVLRRESNGGGRVLAGGRRALSVVGNVSCLMIDLDSSTDASASMLSCSSLPRVSSLVFRGSSWRLGPSLNASPFNDGSRFTDTFSSLIDGGRGPSNGIDGVGKSL